MIWKIYFWILFTLSLIGFIVLYGELENWNLMAFFEASVQVLSFLGLYSFVYKKKMFTTTFWMYFFYLSIGMNVISFLSLYTPLQYVEFPDWLYSGITLESSKSEMLAGFIFIIPALYTYYKLGKGKFRSGT